MQQGAIMVATLADWLQRDGRSVATVSTWIQHRLDHDWSVVWTSRLGELHDLFDTIGEPAYGVYNRELYRPIQKALNHEGLTCKPTLPGSFALSEEEWGAEDDRERRMWTLLIDHGAEPIGSLVTRFFHDHTRLRLPRPPALEGLPDTDHDTIRAIVLGDPELWHEQN
jgi:hypothetical protein